MKTALPNMMNASVFYENVRKRLREHLTKLIIPLMLFSFFLVYLSDLIIHNIMPGEAGVIWKRFGGGTQTELVYSEGLQLIWPWDIMYIYNIRIQQKAHEFDVLSSDGLTLHLAISVRYYPEKDMLGLLHKTVGTNYVETVVIPEIEAVLRELIGTLRAEQVYTTDQAIVGKSVNIAIERIARRYINVDNVIIKRIIFPPFIATAIEKKMEQQQLQLAYEFKLKREEQEAQRKRIEAVGLKDYNDTLGKSLTPQILMWKGIQATVDLAQSSNAKVVVIGGGKSGLPILGNIPLEPFSMVSEVEPFGNFSSFTPRELTVPSTESSESLPEMPIEPSVQPGVE